jgi:hypothetical protein
MAELPFDGFARSPQWPNHQKHFPAKALPCAPKTEVDRKSRLRVSEIVTLKSWELISLVPSVSVAGMFFEPWVALSRSLNAFKPDVFLALVRHGRPMNFGLTSNILADFASNGC